MSNTPGSPPDLDALLAAVDAADEEQLLAGLSPADRAAMRGLAADLGGELAQVAAGAARARADLQRRVAELAGRIAGCERELPAEAARVWTYLRPLGEDASAAALLRYLQDRHGWPPGVLAGLTDRQVNGAVERDVSRVEAAVPAAGPVAVRPDNQPAPDPPDPSSAGPLPDLPARDARLYAIHYSQEKIENSATQTPPVSAIVVQHVLTQDQRTFAAFNIAERGGIVPSEFPTRLPGLEKQLLKEFFDFAAAHPEAVWLSWNMRGPLFGFEVLAQRARLHGLSPDEIPSERRFNLAGYLKARHGDKYAPHPRLWHAIHQNGVNGPGLLNEDQSAAAWKKGEYAALLQSLACKVDAIADLFDRVHAGTFQTCAPDPAPEASRPLPAPSTTDAASYQYVTLDHMAAIVSRSKRTLEKLKTRMKNPLPPPDVEGGGGGKPDEWRWGTIRPWLEAEYGRQLSRLAPGRPARARTAHATTCTASPAPIDTTRRRRRRRPARGLRGAAPTCCTAPTPRFWPG
jgi:hypothetical protein